jgi:hypothetical protein
MTFLISVFLIRLEILNIDRAAAFSLMQLNGIHLEGKKTCLMEVSILSDPRDGHDSSLLLSH